jgi:TatD DNase family protein
MSCFDNRFFDSHCHFDFVEFNADRAALWRACNAEGITQLLIPGVTPDQWQTAAQLCVQYAGLCYAAGIHPHWIEQQPWFPTDTNNLLDKSVREKITALILQEFNLSTNVCAARCVAVGESGLDKMIATPFDLQQELLTIHIDVARQIHKPLIVHCVRAHNEMIALLKKHKPVAGGVIHAFSGSYEVAQQYVDLGFYLGIGGTITYERAQKTRAAAAKIPLEFLVLETDAPDMPLHGKQGQRNSPEYLPQIAQVLADLHDVAVDEIAAVTYRNTMRLFHRS